MSVYDDKVVNPLVKGEKVIVSGVQALDDGVKIRIVEGK